MGLTFQIPLKLRPFFEEHRRFKVAYGGRGGGKSETFAAGLAMKAQTERALVGCFREFQNSIEDSVYSLIKSTINKYDIPGFNIQKSQIDHEDGGGMRFKGLARSVEGIKSMYGMKYFWLEEGQFISAESLKLLTPTLREKNSECWISANPMSSADPFSQRFIVPFQKDLDAYGIYMDDLHLIIKINYDDNPWFPKELESERMHDYTHLPRALYDHIWLGCYNDHIEHSIIKSEWFDAAVDSHKKLGFEPRGAIIVAHDPSDLGTDDKSMVVRKGSVITDARLKHFGDVNNGCDWACDHANRLQADVFTWDADGMGLSLKRQVNEAFRGKKISVQPFRGSAGPHDRGKIYNPIKHDVATNKQNKDVFKNARAQHYWYMRDRFYNTYQAVEEGKYVDPESMISISSDIDILPLLRSEVCRIPRKPVGSGMIQIMTKAEMKRLKIQSPNLADAMMMTMITPKGYNTGSSEQMVFDSFWE